MKRNLIAIAIAAAFATPLAFAAGDKDKSSAGSSGAQPSSQGAQSGSQGGQLSAAETFSRLDTNNDGYISKAEAGLMPDVIVIFPVADTDKDDRLSRSELDEGMKKRSASAQGSGSSSQGGSATPQGSSGSATQGSGSSR